MNFPFVNQERVNNASISYKYSKLTTEREEGEFCNIVIKGKKTTFF